MQFDDLPSGWQAATLGHVVEYGKTQKCELSDVSTDTWILELEDIEKESSKIVQRLNAETRPFKSTKNKFKKGDVLYGKLRPYLNKVVIADQDGVCSTEIIPLDAEPCVDNRYLFYWLKGDAFLNYVVEVSYGVNMPRLGTQDGLTAPFVLPPLAEQKVIAEKLDTLLAQVDNTKARLERIPEILKRFRQSLLAAAVSGKLTEEWRDGNTLNQLPSLVEKYTIDDEYSFVVPLVWKLTAIGNCATFQQGLQIAKATRRTEPANDVLPILRTVNYENGFNDDIHYAIVDDKSIIAEPEDIIISRTGTVGRVLTGYRGIMHNNSFRINYDKQLLLREYLIFFLKSPTCQEYVKENSGRSSQPDLTHKAFAKCPLALPSISEQAEIVRRVEELFAFADRIEQAAQAALSRVNNLTQSILAKAFRGELTADWRAANPELISGENSAEALLKRIKAERAKSTKKTKAKA